MDQQPSTQIPSWFTIDLTTSSYRRSSSRSAYGWVFEPGLPCRATIAVSSRATRRPEIEVSGIAPRHSLVTSLTMLRTRKRRPLANWSWTKSSDQRTFGFASRRIGTRPPTALRRARRLRTESPSSRSTVSNYGRCSRWVPFAARTFCARHFPNALHGLELVMQQVSESRSAGERLAMNAARLRQACTKCL